MANKNGTHLNVSKDYKDSFKDSVENLGFLNWSYSPLDELERADNSSSQKDNRINLAIKYDLPFGFSFSAQYQMEKQNVTNKAYYSDSSYYARSIINKFTNLKSSNPYPVPVDGILSEQDEFVTNHNVRAQLDYNKIIGRNHEIHALMGSELNPNTTESSFFTAYGYDKDIESSNGALDFYNYYPLNPGGGSDRIPNNLGFSKNTDHFISYYGNAYYTFLSRYVVSISGRIDKSNLFGVSTNQKSVPLYSTGIAWMLNKEDFYHSTLLPVLKLRATFGYNGNISKTATAVATIIQYQNSPFFNLNYADVVNPGNPDLRWERTRMINLGTDFSFYKDIVSGSFEYYLKKGLDLFGNSPLAPSVGFSTYFGNNAGTAGRGFDLNINTRNIQDGKFTWASNLLLSYSTDKIIKYNSALVSSSSFVNLSGASSFVPIKGKPIYGIYSYKWAGLTHDEGNPQGVLDNKPSVDYANILSNTPIDSLIFNGPARPTMYGAFRNTFSICNFSLSVNIIFKFNYYFRRSSISYIDLFDAWIGHTDFKNRWQNPGDENHTNIPSIQYPPADQNRELFYSYSNALIVKGDHIRIQDVNFSYNLGAVELRKIHLNTFQIYSYINNLGILWRSNKLGLDPDLFGQSLPSPKTYALGIRATF